MRFLIDVNLPPALKKLLNDAGHEAEHAIELQMQRTKDHDIRACAETTSSIIVTKDEDFVALNLRAGNGPPVIWVRYGNLRNRSLLEKFGAALPSPVKQIEAGEAVIELI